MFEIEIDNFIGEDFFGTGITAKFIKDKLKEADGSPVQFNINSPGGYVTEGLAIFNVIKNYKGEKTAVITGLAASMASIIPLATDRVFAENNAIYMIHNPLNIAIGDYQIMAENAEFLERMAIHLTKEYIGKTGKSEEKIRDWMDEETWFFGKEISKAGFIDELLPPKNKIKKNGKAVAAVSDRNKDKESNLINAQLWFADMKKEMSKHETKSSDLQEAMATLQTIQLENPKTTESVLSKKKGLINNNEKDIINKNKAKEIKMDLITLKTEHSDLIEQLEKAVTAKERKRVCAHLTFIEAAKDSVIKNIKDGVSFMDEEVQASYIEARMKKGIIADAGEENPPKVDSDPDAAPESGKDKTETEGDPMENDSEENVNAFLAGEKISAKKV